MIKRHGQALFSRRGSPSPAIWSTNHKLHTSGVEKSWGHKRIIWGLLSINSVRRSFSLFKMSIQNTPHNHKILRHFLIWWHKCKSGKGDTIVFPSILTIPTKTSTATTRNKSHHKRQRLTLRQRLRPIRCQMRRRYLYPKQQCCVGYRYERRLTISALRPSQGQLGSEGRGGDVYSETERDALCCAGIWWVLQKVFQRQCRTATVLKIDVSVGMREFPFGLRNRFAGWEAAKRNLYAFSFVGRGWMGRNPVEGCNRAQWLIAV